MANPAINFAGFLYDDAGDAISGATVNLYDKNTSTTSRASTTTDSNGAWSIAHTTAGEFDVQITSGSSKRRIKFDDKVHLSELDAEVLNVRGNEGAAAPLYFFSDEGDDAGDRWLFNAAAGGVFTMGNDIQSQGTYVAHVTITPHATVASSTFAIAGAATVGGSLNISTVAAAGGDTDKFLVLDSSGNVDYRTGTQVASDIGAITSGVSLSGSTDNTVVTVTGANATQGEANLTFDGSTLAVTGDLTVSGGDGALQFTNAGENSIKIPDNQASALIIEEANNAYMTFVSSNSSEKITFAKALDIDAAVQIDSTVTVGVDDTGHDVKFFGASSGAYFIYDQSEDQVEIRGAAADATTSTGKLLLTTALTDINANDVIGKVSFQAPLEAGGTDAITVAASIEAVAQGTFSASVNATDIIFKTGHSEAATEKFRFTSQGEIGIGGTNYGSDGQVLTSGGAGAAPAWEDAGGSGTFTAVAIEDLAAGDPVALVDDSGTVKVEKIRGMTEHASDPKTSVDAIAHVAYRNVIFHCSNVDKWARVYNDNTMGYYLWIQVGDFSTTTNSITWGEAVAVTDYGSYPPGGCWVGGSFDRIFAMGGDATNDVKGWLYQINTSTNKVVTSTADPLFAPGTPYVITDGLYSTGGGVVCHFATSGEAANKIIVMATRNDGTNTRKQEIHALTPTGGSTNTVTDYIAGEYIQNVQNTGTYPAFAWNDNGNGAGLMTYIDGGDSNYFKLKSFIMNDTPGWTFDTAVGSTGRETLGADQTQRNAGGDTGVGSITADTSNGNFVLWLRGASDGSAAVAVVNVNPSNAAITPSGGDRVAATTIFANMSAHAGIARDFSNLTNSDATRLPISNTATAGIHSYAGAGIYDPDTDSHIFIYPLRMHKTTGHTEYSLSMTDSTWVAAIVTVTLSGTNDFDMAITEPDWFKPINRYGSMNLDAGAYDNHGYALAYDTTHNQALFESHHGSDYTTHYSSLPYDSQFLFQGTTTANKYRRSNMDKFIGFNTAAVTISSSTAATITVAGGLNENQSGLTKGERYYIGDGGVLRATAPVSAFYLYKAGIATDTSKLLVQADYMTPGNVS